MGEPLGPQLQEPLVLQPQEPLAQLQLVPLAQQLQEPLEPQLQEPLAQQPAEQQVQELQLRLQLLLPQQPQQPLPKFVCGQLLQKRNFQRWNPVSQKTY